jgi:hypothetical protein
MRRSRWSSVSSTASLAIAAASDSASGSRSDACRAELCRAPCQVVVNGDDGRADGVEELVHLGVGPLPHWADHDLRVHGRAHDDLLAHTEPGSQFVDRASVLVIGRVEERDHDAGVERYSRHSPRSSSR